MQPETAAAEATGGVWDRIISRHAPASDSCGSANEQQSETGAPRPVRRHRAVMQLMVSPWTTGSKAHRAVRVPRVRKGIRLTRIIHPPKGASPRLLEASPKPDASAFRLIPRGVLGGIDGAPLRDPHSEKCWLVHESSGVSVRLRQVLEPFIPAAAVLELDIQVFGVQAEQDHRRQKVACVPRLMLLPPGAHGFGPPLPDAMAEAEPAAITKLQYGFAESVIDFDGGQLPAERFFAGHGHCASVVCWRG